MLLKGTFNTNQVSANTSGLQNSYQFNVYGLQWHFHTSNLDVYISKNVSVAALHLHISN